MLNDFYPTPKGLIGKMVDGLDLEVGSSVLEPSAGKGDICDYLRVQHERVNIDVIEIDADLQATLKGKGYNLVCDDFLGFATFKKYDLILANFPFSDGDRHLQKALQLQEQYGGDIICLVNAETIRNPFSNIRKAIVAKLTEYDASIEYLQGEFENAERRTTVEVALVRISIPARDKTFLILDHLKQSEQVNLSEAPQQQLVDLDLFNSLVARFNVECRLGINLITEYFALKPYMQDRVKKGDEFDRYSRPLIELKIEGASDYSNNYINEYLKGLRLKYWQLLLSNDGFRRRYTSNIHKELDSKLNTLRECDFSLFNIRQLDSELKQKLVVGVEDAILDLFDQLTQKYSYHEECGKNIHYYNGWKTNTAYKINKKVILPINGFSSYSWKRDKIDGYYIREKLQDMVKVFNYLAGELSDVDGVVRAGVDTANELAVFRGMDFHYFETTFYKKGTCHITFKDDRLVEKFNIYGSQRKGWLPPSYGKKRYREMTREEQVVVDEFQGQEKYAEVMQDKEYYLVTSSMVLLEENVSTFAA